MKLHDREMVDGTRITIGRKAQYRTIDGQRVEKISKTYTAVFTDAEGNRRFHSLGTTLRRDARRKAIEIQAKLDEGRGLVKPKRLSMADLIRQYRDHCLDKDLAPKSRAKYKSELDKVEAFCDEHGVRSANGFDETVYYRYAAWLRTRPHKQGVGYQPKSIYASLAFVKQLQKWAWRQRLIPEYKLAPITLPPDRPRPQPTFTTDQIEELLRHCQGRTHDAIAIGAYAGLRAGELIQLQGIDVRLDLGELGMLHIRRGGSGSTTKSGEDRFVPIHSRIRPILERLPRDDRLVLPGLRDRTLLAQIKRLSKQLGFGDDMKTHSLRHHFASMCANSSIPYRMALAWLGHSSSRILDLYYHLHDRESEAAMMSLAEQGKRLADRTR